MLTRSDDLDILLMVVDSGGFSAAADALNIQVARVSRAVSKIEQQLGVTILNRTTRRVELTDEGRQFVESVRGGLQQLQRAEDELVRRGELPQGRLRVDAASPFVFHQLVPLMKDFRAAYPDIELALTSNEGYVDLLEKRTDVAIRIGKLADSTLHARPLGKSALHIVASAEYLARRGVPQKVPDLVCHELLGFTEPKTLNHWPLKGCDVITPTISTSNGETLRQLALAGNGIACLSGFMINEDLAVGRLVSILQSDKFTHIEREQVSAVYYKSSIVARRISAFIEFIQPRLTL
ncbi:LysR family transcriptional regulator [Shewanella sp.]|uniref:LysR family transcriptional regulator n=1 Tax=Shewanella sp. TaxID=50422 RepID=UPI004054281D